MRVSGQAPGEQPSSRGVSELVEAIDHADTSTPPPRGHPELPRQQPFHPRYVSLVLGGWLLVSAFLLPHTELSQMNAWIVGALVVLASLFTFKFPVARPLNAALGLWLLASSALFYPRTDGTFFHNLIIAFTLIALSFMPTRARAPEH